MASTSTSTEKPITIRDLARLIGVSKSTASLALSTTEADCPLAPATRQRVIEAAAKLGYRPNHRARALATNRSHSVGLVYADEGPMFGAYYGQMINTLSRELLKADLDLMLVPAIGGDKDWGRKLMDQRIDACLAMQPVPMDLARVLGPRHLPPVILNDNTITHVPRVLLDESAHVDLIVEHLLELGHRRIAWYQPLPPDVRRATYCTHYSWPERRDALQLRLAQEGLSDQFTSFGEMSADDAVQRWQALPEDQRPTAIVCYTDDDAHALRYALWQAGIDVPNKVSLVAFNDDRLSAVSTPPLTSIAMPMEGIATEAVKLLRKYMAPNAPDPFEHPVEVRLTGKLIVRASTAAPPN